MPIHNRDWYQGSSEKPGWQPSGGVMQATPVFAWILALTIGVFVLQLITPMPPPIPNIPSHDSYVGHWLKVTEAVKYGQIWRLVTYAFCHSRLEIFHILWNMLFFFWFGRELEMKYGSREFLLFYLGAAVCAGLTYLILHLSVGTVTPMLGASGAVMAVMMLYAMHFPRRKILFMFFIPLEIRWLVLFYVIMETMPVLQMLGGEANSSGVAHSAHFGGLAFGFFYWKFKWRLEYRWQWLTSWVRLKRHGRKVRARRPAQGSRPEPQASMRDMAHEFDDEIDRILDKVAKKGYKKLSERERTLLASASERYETEKD